MNDAPVLGSATQSVALTRTPVSQSEGLSSCLVHPDFCCLELICLYLPLNFDEYTMSCLEKLVESHYECYFAAKHNGSILFFLQLINFLSQTTLAVLHQDFVAVDVLCPLQWTEVTILSTGAQEQEDPERHYRIV